MISLKFHQKLTVVSKFSNKKDLGANMVPYTKSIVRKLGV